MDAAMDRASGGFDVPQKIFTVCYQRRAFSCPKTKTHRRDGFRKAPRTLTVGRVGASGFYEMKYRSRGRILLAPTLQLQLAPGALGTPVDRDLAAAHPILDPSENGPRLASPRERRGPRG